MIMRLAHRLILRTAAAVLAVLVLAASFGPAVTTAQPSASERPNIILIMTDDQGYGDFGFTGNPAIETPNLNTMAARSARMTQFYVSPVCAPTRASLMTGRYNYRTRVVDTYLGRAMMEPDEVTIAELLGEAGYATGIFGKWHLGDNYPLRPQDQGFEEVLVHRGGGIGQPSDPPGGEGKYTDPILFHNGEKVQEEGYVTDIYFEEGIQWMEEAQEQDRPFFAYIATNAPHGPFHDVPEDTYQFYRERDLGGASPRHAGVGVGRDTDLDRLARIFAMITNIDENVGRLFSWLDRRELTEDTMVLFLVDNGPNTRRYVGGLRGKKTEVHEGGVRSPLWIHWPAELQAGRTSGRIAAHIDVAPTLLEAAGVAAPDTVQMDGRSLLPLLRGEGDVEWPNRMLFIQAHRGNRPVRYHHFMARSERWKLVRPSGFRRQEPLSQTPDFELYDMRRDPLETRDVSEEHPAVVERLRQEYDAWFEDVSETRTDNYAPPRIAVGTPHENPVVLTRQDWRYEGSSGGWSRGAQGYWLLRVADAGPYEVRFRLKKEAATSGTARLKVGDRSYEEAFESGADRVRFEDVELPTGPVRLDAVLVQDEATRGAHQVVLARRE